jgi:hypothetical protein
MNNNIIPKKGYKMFTKRPNKRAICLFLCVLFVSVSTATDARKTAPGRRPCAQDSAEKYFLTLLGLREDVNDAEIIELLDIPEKQLFAMGLVSYRKISSATPKLLQIVNDANTFLPAKIYAADTLCDLGNREWMPTIKPLSLDPNSIIARTTLKIKVAGLLARAGDYSQFEIVAAAVIDSKHYVRFSGICELANFRHKTAPVTDLAVELLVSVATADPDPGLRQVAIYSLEKIAKEKPQIIPKLIDALEANKDSPDKHLGISSRVNLKIYGLKRSEEESKQP